MCRSNKVSSQIQFIIKKDAKENKIKQNLFKVLNNINFTKSRIKQQIISYNQNNGVYKYMMNVNLKNTYEINIYIQYICLKVQFEMIH